MATYRNPAVLKLLALCPDLESRGKGSAFYIIAFDNGTLKVGLSDNPLKRLSGIVKTAASFFINPVDVHVSPVTEDAYLMEMILQSFCSLVCEESFGEYFKGVEFDRVLAVSEIIFSLEEKIIREEEYDLGVSRLLSLESFRSLSLEDQRVSTLAMLNNLPELQKNHSVEELMSHVSWDIDRLAQAA